MRFPKGCVKHFTALVLGAALLNGCASSRKIGWEDTSEKVEISAAEKSQLMRDAKRLWNTRHIRADLEAALEKFSAVARSGDSEYEALVFLTRGYYLLADAHEEQMDQKKKLWETSVAWGEKGMALNEGFRKAVVEEKKSVTEALPLLGKEQIDALYWAAASLGKWAKNSGIATTLKYKNQIRAMVERVQALNDKFFYGAVYRYWGTFYAVAPGFAGGSMEKSLENYQKSLKLANNYLGTHVLYAENYLSRKGDKENFKKELNFVLDTKPETIPELVPEQLLEKRKAKLMLENIDEYF